MKTFIRIGFWLGLAIWTFIIGGFYGLINYGGDFIAWFNAAFLGLAPEHFGTLVQTLQSIGAVICIIIWLMGAVAMYVFKYMGLTVAGKLRAVNISAGNVDNKVGGPTINSSAREL